MLVMYLNLGLRGKQLSFLIYNFMYNIINNIINIILAFVVNKFLIFLFLYISSLY